MGGAIFVILHHHGALRHVLQALAHDLVRLAHFLHAAQIARVAIAGLADRNIEIHFIVHIVRLRLAQIPRHARGAQHRPRKAPIQRLVPSHDADIDRALLEDAIFGQQLFDIGEEFRKAFGIVPDILGKAFGHILMHAAGTEIIGVHARTAHAFIKFHQDFALLETPQRRRDRAEIDRESRDVKNVVEDAGDFREQHADILPAQRHCDAEQLFNRQRKGVLLAHRRNVIEPVEIGRRLRVGFVFDQFFGAAMQKADMRIGAFDDFAVHLEDQAQHAMRGRMLRPEIHRERADFLARLGVRS